MPILRLLSRDGSGVAIQTLNVPAAAAVIGRSESAGVFIDDPSISRQHARILETENGWMVVELQSTNGIVVNGQRVPSLFLADGTVFRLGLVDLEFRLQDSRDLQTIAVEGSAADRARPPAPEGWSPPQPAVPTAGLGAEPIRGNTPTPFMGSPAPVVPPTGPQPVLDPTIVAAGPPADLARAPTDPYQQPAREPSSSREVPTVAATDDTLEREPVRGAVPARPAAESTARQAPNLQGAVPEAAVPEPVPQAVSPVLSYPPGIDIAGDERPGSSLDSGGGIRWVLLVLVLGIGGGLAWWFLFR